jgi:hypothetical protein
MFPNLQKIAATANVVYAFVILLRITLILLYSNNFHVRLQFYKIENNVFKNRININLFKEKISLDFKSNLRRLSIA